MASIFAGLRYGAMLLVTCHMDATPQPPRFSGSGADSAGLGTCAANGTAVDLRQVLFLENRSMEFESAEGRIRVNVLGQTVSIEPALQQGDRRIYSADVGSLVTRQEDDADVTVKLALFNNRPVIYWRETFQNRVYRQGLFSIVRLELIPLCEGRAGTTYSH